MPIIGAVFEGGASPETDDALAFGGDEISAGSGTFPMMLSDETTEWTGTGGTTYDVYIFIDRDLNDEPSPGDYVYKSFDPSGSYVQDGDETITTEMADYSKLTL